MTAAAAPPIPYASALTTGPLLSVPTPKPQWMHYGDWIRILGTVAVVVGHVADMTLYTARIGSANWWTANWWDAATRWAVPVYIMLSGSLLLDPARGEPAATFYRKRLGRLGVPLVFWSLLFMWFDVCYTGWRATTLPAFEVDDVYKWADHTRWQWFVYLVFTKPQQAWRNLLVGQPYMHMHFMFRIAGLYAFTPVLRVVVRDVPRRMLAAAVVLMLVLSSADSVANNLTGTSLSMFARFVPFLGYYLLGYLLRAGDWSGRTLALCWAGLIGSVAAVAWGTGPLAGHFVGTGDAARVHAPPSLDMMLYDFLSPPRVVMAVCAWVVLVSLFRDPWPHGKAGRGVVRFWANTTLGLYLIHPIFREVWYLGRIGLNPHPWFQASDQGTNYGVDAVGWFAALFHHSAHPLATAPWWQGPIVGVPVVAVLVYVPALVATVVLMRIPFVRRVAG